MRWTDSVLRLELPNGLTVLVQREVSAPVVAVSVHVKAGYLDEPDEVAGVSHVLEHMYFKGTGTLGPGDIATEIQSLGGYINAGTIYDHTGYQVVLPAAGGGWRRALEVQGDALMRSTIDPSELARELEVIVQEARRKQDNPPALTRETLYAVLFPDHPMGRWRIGTEEGLRALTREDVFGYYRSRYRPDNTIVAIVGDIEPDDVLAQAVAVFGDWDAPVTEVVVPGDHSPPPPPQLRSLNRDVQRAIASIGWKTVPEADPGVAALDYAAAVLTAGRGSRLYRCLREPGLVSGAFASHYTPTVLGVFELFLQGEVAVVEQAMATALGAVEGLAMDLVSQREMERTSALLETERARYLESMVGRATTLCHYEALGDFRLADDRWESLMAVTPADIGDVAARMLGPAVSSAVVCLPEGVSLSRQAWPFETVATAPKPVVAVAPSPRPTGGPRAGIGTVGDVAISRCGGTDFLARVRPGSGLCTVGLYLKGLATEETERTAGLTTLLLRASMRGIEGHGPDHLAEASELLGGTPGPAVRRDFVGWRITVRNGESAAAVDLLRRVATAATLAPDQVVIERDQQVSDARSLRDDMYGYPVRQTLRNALAESDYGLPIRGDAETVAGFTADDVHRWRERIAACSPTVIVVGDIDPAPLLEQLAASWQWSGEPHAVDLAPVGWRAASESEVRAKEQTALAMAFPAGTFTSPDRHAIRVLCSIMGGMTGRLFEELRERRSLAYTVSATPWLQARSGAVVTYIATAPEREDEARECMLAELLRVAEEGVSDDEVARVRTYLAGAEQMKLQSSGVVAADIAQFHHNGVLAALPEEIAALRSVTAADVHRVAGEIFRPEARSEYVVRGDPSYVALPHE